MDNNTEDELVEFVSEEPDELEPLIDQEEDYVHGIPLLVWKGPSDLPEEENRRWFVLIMFATVVLILFALVIHNGILALIFAGIAWVSLMIRRLPSQDIEYIVTTTGFFSQDKFYPWSELSSFWIIKDHGHYILGLDTNRKVFSSVMILLGNQNPLEVKNVLSQYIPFKEDRTRDFLNILIEKGATWLDNAIEGVVSKSKDFQQNRKAKAAMQKMEQKEAESAKETEGYTDMSFEPPAPSSSEIKPAKEEKKIKEKKSKKVKK